MGRAREHLRDCCRESAREAAPRLHGHAAQFAHGYLCLDEGDTPFDPAAGRARRRETGISGCARARTVQLEGLYTMCLLIEKAKHVDRFVKEAWKRQYVSYLLMREETKSLDRFIEAQSDVLELSRLLKLAAVWNVTEPERLTIEYEELEPPPAAEFVREPIRNFPTPGLVIKELPAGPKRAMLERLYPEYQDLCAYAHGRPIAGFNKAVFDGRSPLRKMFSMADIQKTFQERIEANCQVYSLMSIAQSAAELTTLYPNDTELTSAVMGAWNELHDAHLLAIAVWNIRTKSLLGVVG